MHAFILARFSANRISALCATIISLFTPIVLWSADTEAGANTLWIATNGNDEHSGSTPQEALMSVEAAIAKLRPGMEIRFAAGDYPILRLEGVKGTETAPILIAAASDAAGKVRITAGRLDRGTGLTLENCAYVEVRGFAISNTMKGIDVMSCSHCRVTDNTMEELGQEAIHVGRLHTNGGTKEFLGPDSEYVYISGNTITGTGKGNETYGEGIYIGTGAFPGDASHHILIERNRLSDISAEAIELKPGTTNIVVRGNSISNTHHHYNAAITVAIEGSEGPDGNYVIENNLIWNIKKVEHSVAGIAIGHGNAMIRNNLIWSIEGGVGIRVYQTFKNPNALNITLEQNTVMTGAPGPCIIPNLGGADGKTSSLVAKVKSQNNLTQDGSENSTMAATSRFQGPLEADADSGQGPGSGYQPRNSTRAGADYLEIKKATSSPAKVR